MSPLIYKAQRYLMTLVAAFVVCCAVLPLFFGLVIIMFPLRLLVQWTAPLFVPNLAGIFSGKGAVFALESIYTRPKLTTLAHLVFEGKVPSIDEIRMQFQQRVLSQCDRSGKLVYVRLMQRWTEFCGYVFWQWDEKFSLNNHIRYYDETEPELLLPEVCTEEDLKRVTGGLISKPYRDGQSPWEILVIPKYRSTDNQSCKEQTVLVFRIHHAMADGYSILKMLLKFMGHEGTKVPRPNLPKVSRWRRILEALVTPLKLPFYLASQLVFESCDGPNAWHLVGQELSKKYETFCSDQVPVWKIKEIKNRHDVGYNAVVYAVAIGAIKRLMNESDQEIPDKISCFVPFPLPNHPGGLVIHSFGFFLTFSPRKQNPVELLHHISRKFDNVRDSPTVFLVSSKMVDIMATLPVWILRSIYNRVTVMTMVMSSFPGPEEQVDWLGTARLTDIIPAMGHPPGETGAIAALVSYTGKQRVVLTVDKEIFRVQGVHVPSNFAKHIDDEVEVLLRSDANAENEKIQREYKSL